MGSHIITPVYFGLNIQLPSFLGKALRDATLDLEVELNAQRTRSRIIVFVYTFLKF